MVAAHDWDIMGARQLGMPSAFVARCPAGWGLPDPTPEIPVPDFKGLADRPEASI